MYEKILKIVGGKTLIGDVTISGAKNAALPGLAATTLSSKKIKILNVPNVDDVIIMIKALRSMGSNIVFDSNIISAELNSINSDVIAGKIAGSIRASILFLGPMLARNGFVRVSQPGGCSIGHRGINYHFEGLRKMGASIEIIDNDIVGKADKLSGTDYTFPGKTVTGTENLIMAASLAEGDTILRNCALEPEIDDLILLLNKMGADVKREGKDNIIIIGKTSLDSAEHRIIPDRIEMGTYVIAACLVDNDITIKNTRPGLIKSLLDILKKMSIKVTVKNGSITVSPNKEMLPVNIETAPFPGFPTDLQAQLMVLLTQTNGTSYIKESIFNNRFNHANELNKMGANISIKNDFAEIQGATNLKAHNSIFATDLRASAALVLGALIAEGKTTINNASQLFRGYEDLPGKLSKLGAKIKVVNR